MGSVIPLGKLLETLVAVAAEADFPR
jgi:hypothetical protein